RCEVGDERLLLWMINALGIIDVVPGLRVIQPVASDIAGHVRMKNFANSCGVIAVPAKELPNGDHIGHRVAHAVAEIVNVGRVGPNASHQRGARWSAEGKLAVRAGKPGAARGQPIQIRSLDWSAVATEFRVLVVHGDKQDVLFAVWQFCSERRGGGGCRCGNAGLQKASARDWHSSSAGLARWSSGKA